MLGINGAAATSAGLWLLEPVLEHCNWKITAPLGHYVTLEFHIIDVSNLYAIEDSKINIYGTYFCRVFELSSVQNL